MGEGPLLWEEGGEKSLLPHPLVEFSLTFSFLSSIKFLEFEPSLTVSFLPFCLGSYSRCCESTISYSAVIMLFLGFQFPHVSLQAVSN